MNKTMKLFNLLFTSQGRLSPNDFLRAMILLLGFQVVCSVVVALSAELVVIIGFINGALIFPYACVFSKRFHDNGKSGYWFLPVLLVYFVASSIVANVLGVFYAEYMESFSEEFQTIFEQRDLTELAKLMQRNAVDMFFPNLVTMIVQTLATALPVAILSSDPDTNAYGSAQTR